MREMWSRGVAERAARYWTAERTARLTGGKRMAVLPAEAAPLLRALGLLRGDGSLVVGAERKYRQVNALAALLAPAFAEVAARATPVRILDAGCGRSYLSFLLAHCFTHVWRHPVDILGVDRNARLIDRCRERYAMTGLPGVARFQTAALGELRLDARPDVLVALHACDTATDDAIALGVGAEVGFIAVAPCCQAELARRWGELAETGAQGAFAPIWRSPHLRRELGASVTDAMRALLLASRGYQVTAMEFVGAEHTPKNTLLRAHLRGGANDEALRAYRELKAATGGVGIGLEERLG